ncbi:YbbR-like domain-containing protein [Microbacteriaceae bacterium 4G12]
MDKLMSNHWFLKGIALLLACMLYMSVNLEKQPQSNFTTGFPVGDTTATLSNVAVSADYDQDKFIVTGIPKSVKMTLEGSSNVIASTKIKQQFEVFINLRGYDPGTYEVRLQYTGIPEDLKVKLEPAKVKVTIQKKVVKSFPVEVGFLNDNQIQAGYTTDKVSVKPGAVEIAGTEDELAQIGTVKAYVDLKGADQTFTKETKVVVYDKDGNPLEVQTKPANVAVTVPIVSPEKKVPLKITRKGSLQEGITVTNISVDPQEVTIYGRKDILDGIQSLEGIVVDLDKITDTTTFDAPIVLPKGVIKSSPNKVKVTVQVDKKARTSLTDIPLKVTGLGDKLKLNFIDPQSGKISVNAVGDAAAISKLDASQIQASINVQNLVPGTYDIPIQVNSTNDVTLELNQKNAKVEIVNKS